MNTEYKVEGFSLGQCLTYIKKLIEQGGPQKHEWPQLNNWIESVVRGSKNGLITSDELESIRTNLGEALSLKTLQGYSFHKPHGYAGDFQIIDHMYTYHVSSDASLKRWDEFYQEHDTVRAVRNRKNYFKKWVLEKVKESKNRTLSILNIASGPCRDIAELMKDNPELPVTFDCIEIDANAISHAKSLLPESAQIEFINCNIFKFETSKSYDLIWSAGLFDYFDDSAFKLILSKLLRWAGPGTEIAIGNFQPNHGTYYYLEFVDWHLYQRSELELKRLALCCGVSDQNIRVGAEVLGANLFLHLRKPEYNVQ